MRRESCGVPRNLLLRSSPSYGCSI
uniref:Uncharacterized protein n=1 Tax=Arundo donax TaxID=35708 RepID=A0A0A9TD37_ARUDO